MIDYFKDLVCNPVALFGLLVSVIILVSMCFNTRTRKGELIFRATNLFGSAASVVYGFFLSIEGLGVIVLNGILIFVNMYYFWKSLKNK